MSDHDMKSHIDDPVAEFEQWRQNMLRWCRFMWVFAFTAEIALIYMLWSEGEYAALPNVVVSAFVLLGARFLLTNRVLTRLRQLRDSS